MIRIGETHLHIGVGPLSASPSRRFGSVGKSASRSKMFSYVFSGWRGKYTLRVGEQCMHCKGVQQSMHAQI